jgi:redoxin
MELHERFAAQRDRFVILAFHDDTVQDFAELDAKLAPIVARAWNGRALPFPILLDASGKTLETYGISAFPTSVLIDPEGRVVAQNAEERLAAELMRKK